MKIVVYVIASRLEEDTDNPIIKYASNIDIYANVKTVEINGKEYKKFEWVDLLDATMYDTLEEAQSIVNTMPFKHVIEKFEVSK